MDYRLEDYCSFEASKALEKVGFTEYTIWEYDKDGYLVDPCDEYIIGKKTYRRPSHQAALKFLRDKYNICVELVPSYSSTPATFASSVHWVDSHGFARIRLACHNFQLNTPYEKAVEEGILYATNKVIRKGLLDYDKVHSSTK